jgi:hypothetical protein
LINLSLRQPADPGHLSAWPDGKIMTDSNRVLARLRKISAVMVALGVGVQVENNRRYWFFCATAKPIFAG